MADAAYVDEAVKSAPKDYTLASSQELLVKAVRAVIDGTGATGDYLPAVQLIAPSGAVMFTAVPSEPVAAGASADVSWFPGGGVEGASAPDVDIGRVASPLGTLQVTAPTGPTVNLDLPAMGLTPGNYGDASDAVAITVDAYGRLTAVASVPISGGGSVVASDGWVPDTTETWTYASFTAGPPAVGTFTVPGDVRAKYTVGTRIKLVQTTTKYFVVSAVPTYDGTNTTVTVTGGTDYTLANAAISGNAHSYVLNPQGYPGWFNYTDSPQGFSVLTIDAARFAVQGRLCIVEFSFNGTSNVTTMTSTLPIAVASTQVVDPVVQILRCTDNSVSTVVGAARFPQGGSTLTFGKALNSAGGWTNVGAKGAQGYLQYEI